MTYRPETKNFVESNKTALSERELEVVILKKEGHKNKAIARILGLNEKTISTYLYRIYKKQEIDSDLNIYAFINILNDRGVFDTEVKVKVRRVEK